MIYTIILVVLLKRQLSREQKVLKISKNDVLGHNFTILSVAEQGLMIFLGLLNCIGYWTTMLRLKTHGLNRCQI